MHSRQCFIGFPNTSNFVKNTPLRVVFSTLFGYPDETLSLVFGILRNDINGIVNVGFQGGLCFVTFKSSEIFLLVKTCLFTVIDKHFMEGLS